MKSLLKDKEILIKNLRFMMNSGGKYIQEQNPKLVLERIVGY